MLAIAGSSMAAFSVTGPTNGWADLTDCTKQFEARAKADNSGWEMAVGQSVSTAGMNNWVQANWGQTQSYDFTFSFCEGVADFTVNNYNVRYEGLNDIDTLFLQVRATSDYMLGSEYITLNDTDLPNLMSDGNAQYLKICGIEDCFTLSGNLYGNLNAANANERVKFDIIGASGCCPVIPAPGAMLLTGIGSALVACIRRRK